MTEPRPSYTLPPIKTFDKELIERSKKIRIEKNVTHEDIYRRGLEEIIKDNHP